MKRYIPSLILFVWSAILLITTIFDTWGWGYKLIRGSILILALLGVMALGGGFIYDFLNRNEAKENPLRIKVKYPKKEKKK